MEIGGLPLHPLVVHATVVFVPLSVLFSVWFAVLPRHRWLSRWPTGLLAVAAVVFTWAARLSGNALLDARPELAQLVATHQDRGTLLSWLVLPYAALVLAAVWTFASDTALASGRGAQDSKLPALERPLAGVVVVAALALLVLAVLAGDSGSRAVWG